MNREVEKLLSERFHYLGSGLSSNYNGNEITQWQLPDGTVVEIIVLEEDDRELDLDFIEDVS